MSLNLPLTPQLIAEVIAAEAGKQPSLFNLVYEQARRRQDDLDFEDIAREEYGRLWEGNDPPRTRHVPLTIDPPSCSSPTTRALPWEKQIPLPSPR